MNDMFETNTVETKQHTMTYMKLGSVSGELPRHLMLGEKEVGYIVDGDTIHEWYWDNIIDRGGIRYLTFKALEVVPLIQLLQTHRETIISILRTIARAMTALPSAFAQTHNGFIELWRIFMVGEHSVLFLPKTLSDIIMFAVDDETRYEMYGQFVTPKAEIPFALCHQFTQLLYYAITGKGPYHDRETRENRYIHMPLRLLSCDIDPQLSNWIDTTLDLGYRTQREVATAAFSSGQNLIWWIEQTAVFSDYKIIEKHTFEELIAANAKATEFLKEQALKASRKVFWRKKGALITSITIISIIVLSIVGNYIVQQLRPPYTVDMDPPKIIQEFFNAMNELDITKMEASFTRQANNPFEQEVSTLFVNSKMRMAYEGKDTIVRADHWVQEGKQPIASHAMVYGASDVRIDQLNPTEYRVTYTNYAPGESPLYTSEHTDDNAFGTWVAETSIVLDFSFTDKRGFWQIQDIEIVSSTIIDLYQIDTFEDDKGLSPMLL